jgi:fluoroquinolone transport system permease protein
MNITRTLRAVRSLGPVDLKNLRRDPMLKYVLVFPIPMVLVLRYGVPLLQARLLELFAFDLSPYYMLMASFITATLPMMIGAVVGFLLLDQRDDNTLLAIQVTPLSLNGYLLYRLLSPVALSVLAGVLVVGASGLVEMSLAALFTASLAAAPIAPLVALVLAAFASNKVQGYALGKGMGMIMAPPLIAYFITSAWHWVFALAPTYWPVRLFWALHAGEPQAWVYLLVGTVYQLAVLGLLLGRFNRVARG